tara:strand:- start:3152 stop:3436 length:285 start_codon:yes stop_codon:yes gene_type:complete
MLTLIVLKILSEAKRQRKLAEETNDENGDSREAKMAKKVFQATKRVSLSLGDDYIIHDDVKTMNKNEIEAYRKEVKSQHHLSLPHLIISRQRNI